MCLVFIFFFIITAVRIPQWQGTAIPSSNRDSYVFRSLKQHASYTISTGRWWPPWHPLHSLSKLRKLYIQLVPFPACTGQNQEALVPTETTSVTPGEGIHLLLQTCSMSTSGSYLSSLTQLDIDKSYHQLTEVKQIFNPSQPDSHYYVDVKQSLKTVG